MPVICKPSPTYLRVNTISSNLCVIVWREAVSHKVTCAITLQSQVVEFVAHLGQKNSNISRFVINKNIIYTSKGHMFGLLMLMGIKLI